MVAQALSLAMLAFGAGAPTIQSADKFKLAHVFVADQSDSYHLKGKMEGGPEVEFSGDIDLKIVKPGDDGAAEAKLAMSNMQLLMGGNPAPDAGSPEALDAKLDKFGMPGSLSIEGLGFVYVLFSASHYLPVAEVETDGTYAIDWADTAKTSTLKGNGKLIEVKEQDGKKVAVVKNTVEFAPNGQTPGQIESTSEFWLETGRLIKSEGKVTVDDGTVTYSFQPKS